MFCAVVGCSNNSNKRSKNYNQKCRYFSFSKDSSLCDVWVYKCYQQHKFNIKTARICSEHFLNSDYCLKEKLLNLPLNKWKIKPDAIPSVNLPKIPEPQTKHDQRLKRRGLIKSVHEHQQLNQIENEDTLLYQGKKLHSQKKILVLIFKLKVRKTFFYKNYKHSNKNMPNSKTLSKSKTGNYDV